MRIVKIHFCSSQFAELELGDSNASVGKCGIGNNLTEGPELLVREIELTITRALHMPPPTHIYHEYLPIAFVARIIKLLNF